MIKRSHWWLLAAVIVLGVAVAMLQRWRTSREHRHDKAILEAALRHNIHPALVKAVVWRESWFDSGARGTSGEIGLMQIREPTARDWAAAEKNTLFTHFQLLDPVRNTQCGAWYLRRLLNRYRHTDRPLAYALAAYNAGPSHVARWSKGEGATNSAAMLKQMDFPGTRDYVAAVSRRYEHYRKSFPPKDWETRRPRPQLTDGAGVSRGSTP